jgi:hypothetical protein
MGEVIIRWGGRVFSRLEIEAGEAKNHTVVAIGEGIFLGNSIDQEMGIEDYMNHSCSPNIGMADALSLRAMRDVKPNEELTADYAIWLDDEHYVMKRVCNCRATTCRSRITGQDWRRTDVQRANAGYFSPFIEARIANDCLTLGHWEDRTR